MYHSQLIRIARTSFRPVFLNPSLSRAYTVTPPAPNQKTKQTDNTFMYTTLGLVTVAGASYYYFRNTDEGQEFKAKAKAEQDRIKRKSAELGDAAKVRAEGVKQQGKDKWDQVTTKETKTRTGGLVADLEADYNSVKGSAKENLTRARDSTENLYNEARSLGEQKAADAQKKVDRAKNGWYSWFNWGKSKADDIESEAERSASKGAQTVANSAENVKERGA